MPRGPRLDTPGTLHHVIVRGIERKKIVNDNKDRKEFIEDLFIKDGLLCPCQFEVMGEIILEGGLEGGSGLNGLLLKWHAASALPVSLRRYLFLKLQRGHIFGVLSSALGD